MKKLNFRLIWIPHALTILFALFLTLFSFDVFGGSEPLWKQLVGFYLHSRLTLWVLLIFFLARKNALVGAIASIVFAIYMTFRFEFYNSLESLLHFSVPMIISGSLYLLVYFREGEENRTVHTSITSFIPIVILLILLGGMGYVNIDNDGVASNEQGYIGLSNPEKVIEFEDKAFESAIRDCFDLDDGDITWRDIGYRTALDSDDFQPKGRINTLEDLKWFVNLQKIEMQEYEVEGDLSSFSHMENLEVLLMWETDVSGDLSSLSGLENLRAINLSHTDVVGDLSSLSGLETIEEIELVGTAVKGDVSCFDGHENLEVLELEDTYVTGR